MLDHKNFLYIKGLNQIDKFYLNYSDIGYEEHSSLRPIYKVVKERANAYKLVPGFLTSSHEFYECPLESFYCQLNCIDFYRVNSEQYVKSTIKIFSSNYRKSREIEINLNSGYFGSNVVNPMHINEIVNTLNIYIFPKKMKLII